MNTTHSIIPHYLGLTWDHPRGYKALFKASELNNTQSTTAQGRSMSLHWDTQSLEGFESTPLGNLASEYDLLVIDHPHIGEAVDIDCLQPLENFYSEQQIAKWKTQTVGGAMESYFWEGKHWGLPLDVASQVQAYRPDHFKEAGLTVPDNWAEVDELPESLSLCLSVAGPHALSTLFSICTSLNIELAQQQLFETRKAIQALELMQRLYQRSTKNTATLNPINLLDMMSSSNKISLIPLIFGYVNYSTLNNQTSAQVLFCDAPSGADKNTRGSVLGGTGIAITKRCKPNAGLLKHLSWLMDGKTQRQFIPQHAGQPSSRAAWTCKHVNSDWHNFYTDTLETVENAFIRPRYNGYLDFHNHASAILNKALQTKENPKKTIEELNHSWQTSKQSQL